MIILFFLFVKFGPLKLNQKKLKPLILTKILRIITTLIRWVQDQEVFVSLYMSVV